MNELGKKLYTSRAFLIFKIFFLGVAVLLLFNIYWQTFSDPTFFKWFEPRFRNVLSFHWRYPEDIIVYIGTVLFPTVYYAFFRSIRFYENALIINRGLPFFNRVLFYKDIESFKVIHPRYLMGVKRSDCNEEFIFTIKDHDRAIAIFDQHDIPGDFGDKSYKRTVTTSKKLVLFFFSFGLLMFLVQYFGLVGYIFRN